MEPILDETSLVPDTSLAPPERILSLAKLLRDLDAHGVVPVLRSVRDAMERDIGGFRGLRSWCFSFSERVDRDAGRFVAGRLGKQPFIDGSEGLLARVEGGEAIEARMGGQIVVGLAYAALIDSVVVGLTGAARSENSMVEVGIERTDGEDVSFDSIHVLRLVSSGDLEVWSEWIQARLISCQDGLDLCRRATQLFPHLRFGTRAQEQLAALAGADPRFPQVLRHLRALDRGSQEWPKAEPFAPWGSVNYSVESKSTLDHGRLGKLRDFPMPAGFSSMRWSFHTKLAAGMRIYFHPQRLESADAAVVLVGYVGPHLKTVREL
jgi:hypothetical protein